MIRRIRRSKSPEVDAARKERELSEQRLEEARRLTASIERVKEQNHFADMIVEQLLEGNR